MKIETRGLVKRYGSVAALDRVSLEIDPGQIISLLGPNGAGKSTLLRCLAGVIAPDSGQVYFDDQPFRRDRLDIRRRFYFLPDFPMLFGDRSVLRNVGIFLRFYEVASEGVEQRVVELLREFDLLPMADAPLMTLSRGQLYKAALVALMAADPEVWFLDEPFASGMDPHGINAFKRRVKDAAQRGRTILYSTQLLDLAERFSDRVCVIHQGEVRAFNTLNQLRAQVQDQGDNVLEAVFNNLREGA